MSELSPLPRNSILAEADNLRAEAKQLLLMLVPGLSMIDSQREARVSRIVDCIISAATLEVAGLQAAVGHQPQMQKAPTTHEGQRE